MILSFTVIFGAKYLTGMVTSVPPYETFSFVKNNILHQSKNYKNQFENSNFWGMWSLGHVGHVTYSFINMLFISMGIFDDTLRRQILSVGTTANAPLTDIHIWLLCTLLTDIHISLLCTLLTDIHISLLCTLLTDIHISLLCTLFSYIHTFDYCFHWTVLLLSIFYQLFIIVNTFIWYSLNNLIKKKTAGTC